MVTLFYCITMVELFVYIICIEMNFMYVDDLQLRSFGVKEKYNRMHFSRTEGERILLFS